MIEEAVKLRSHANHDEVAMKQLEETITILLEHFKNEVTMKISMNFPSN